MDHITTDDGVKLAYRRFGNGDRTVVVPSMSWLVEDLGPLGAGRTVISYDIRSQGHSDHVDTGRVGFERDIADLECLRTELGLERMTLLGWSYHGAVTARYAFAHRDRVERLVLVAPLAPRAAPHWRKYLENFGKRLDTAVFQRLEQARRDGLPELDPVAWCQAHTDLILRVYVADPAPLSDMRSCPCVRPNLDPEVVNKQTLAVIEKMGDYDWREEMQGFDVPTLIVHGDDDPVPLEGSHEWRDTLADVTLHELPGCGHLPWLEQPDAFYPPIEAFLNRPS